MILTVYRTNLEFFNDTRPWARLGLPVLRAWPPTRTSRPLPRLPPFGYKYPFLNQHETGATESGETSSLTPLTRGQGPLRYDLRCAYLGVGPYVRILKCLSAPQLPLSPVGM